MGTVLTMHGVAHRVNRRRLTDQFVASERLFEQFLSSCPALVPLAHALAGDGTALTVDDATRGSARAARLALARGHHVTLFVNPGQVEHGAPHCLAALSVLLDRVARTEVELDGILCPAATTGDRLELRERIKARLQTLEEESARFAIVKGLAAVWGVGALDLPDHLRTLEPNELRRLRDEGVDVQNHGWSHADHAHLSPEQSAREIRNGRTWLQRELGVDAPFFAVPFGTALPHEGALAECDVWLTADSARPSGAIASRVFNRDQAPFLARRMSRRDRAAWAPAVGNTANIVGRLRRLFLR